VNELMTVGLMMNVLRAQERISTADFIFYEDFTMGFLFLNPKMM